MMASQHGHVDAVRALLDALLDEAGLDMGEPRGIGFSPAKGLHLSGDLSLNYIVTARAR